MGASPHMALGALLPAVFAGAVAAQDAAICAYSFTSEFSDATYVFNPPQDFGDGWVVDSVNITDPSSGSSEFSISFEDCATARSIGANVNWATEEGDQSRRVAAAAVAIMRDEFPSSDPVAFLRAQDRFYDADLGGNSSDSSEESCGCAVFYPDLRGNKLPWTAQ
jgi:hypothetical protein